MCVVVGRGIRHEIESRRTIIVSTQICCNCVLLYECVCVYVIFCKVIRVLQINFFAVLVALCVPSTVGRLFL